MHIAEVFPHRSPAQDFLYYLITWKRSVRQTVDASRHLDNLAAVAQRIQDARGNPEPHGPGGPQHTIMLPKDRNCLGKFVSLQCLGEHGAQAFRWGDGF